MPAAELQLATAAILGAKQPGQPLRLDCTGDSPYAGMPAFKAARARSTLAELGLALTVPEARVKEMLLLAANGDDDDDDVHTVFSATRIWAGCAWNLVVQPMRCSEESGGWALVAGLLTPWTAVPDAAAQRTVANVSFTIESNASSSKRGAITSFIVGDGAAETAYADALVLAGWSGGDLGEEELALAGLVDGALRVTATVTALG